jgi:hypothetical protein
LGSGFDDLFPENEAIDRNAAEDRRMAWEKVPGKGAVYLLVCEEEEGGSGEKPMLLATVGDLRAALKRRLGEIPADAKSRRVPYGRLCSRVYWRRVDSSFAANWWYARAARRLFPETYAALFPWRTSWWIAVEREGPFPRLRKTNNLGDAAMMYAGPVRDKHAAARLIEAVEDLFDLCRYYAELVQAPRGKPCAYKEMGKCPAPCDGSVPIAWYREQMNRAWGFLTGQTRGAWLAETEGQMKAAAERLEFETAARIKQRLTRAAQVEGRAGGDAFGQVRALEMFSFVAIQPGQGKPWAEPWIVHGGHVECLPQVNKKDVTGGIERVLARYREVAGERIGPTLDAVGSEQVSLVSHHLYRGGNEHGIYVHGSRIAVEGAGALREAVEQLWRRKAEAAPVVEQSSEAPPVTIGASTDSGETSLSAKSVESAGDDQNEHRANKA